MIVTIVDYGSGNLRSVAKGFERAKLEAGLTMAIEVTSSPARVALADRIILPGVGTFADCKRGLEAIPGLLEALKSVVCDGGRPFLGICVGMQLMAEQGLENGVTDGLGWVRGSVDKITAPNERLKIPHMGWNETYYQNKSNIFTKIKNKSFFYYVHSYECVPLNKDVITSYTNYGNRICSSIENENIIATQFHPEKSGSNGIKIYKNFIDGLVK